MKRLAFLAISAGSFIFSAPADAAKAAPDVEAPPPMTSQMQAMSNRNTVPQGVKTEIIAVDDEGRKRAKMLIEIYRLLAEGASVDKLRPYIRDDYVQHSPMLPDGPEALSSFFSATIAEYPFAIDVHRVIVVGDWAVAHVNFRNMTSKFPNDLGMAAVDVYSFGPDGKLAEHWDAVQGVPTHSVNPHGMFLRVRGGDQ